MCSFQKSMFVLKVCSVDFSPRIVSPTTGVLYAACRVEGIASLAPGTMQVTLHVDQSNCAYAYVVFVSQTGILYAMCDTRYKDGPSIIAISGSVVTAMGMPYSCLLDVSGSIAVKGGFADTG